MPTIDGDAGRREAAGEPIIYTFKGQTFELPQELPLPGREIVEEAKAEKWDDVRFLTKYLGTLLGDEQWQRYWTEGPSYADLNYLFTKAMEIYGTGPGESSPSASTSRKAGGSSKRSSTASTGSARRRTTSKPAPENS